ncbi:sugar-transfer associated ATP-grasp domain-containing protein [Flavivirga spongiicola]|uniref:Alpha-L-glutamate ligase-related protein ATP-grasp domain-containing protein n=1 Tax=Flavivirga spongiicola TaxID=421621 RepID=A0ABU7XZX8_9FLAO|nr:sugar-transfer associated ATP-grasp domain-containing protein [Flavivirga sp. MEBiC05379]MDO5980419.1 sugar-transfer associated ATP-grasp domain-containing protein [Flavivirga sp. MEBiC05379]
MYYRRLIKLNKRTHRPPNLSFQQKKEIRTYYKSLGYKNIKTDYHEYYIGFNGKFSVKYIPEDIFHPIIAPAFNNQRQWPALLDKNLLDRIFVNIKQPKCVIKNMNGFYYSNGMQITQDEAINICSNSSFLVIKPSIDSGGGTGVVGFSLKNKNTDYKGLSLKEVMNLYSKDFIIQEVLIQHSEMKKLNESSVNTIRLLSFLKEGQVHILASVVRIGGTNSFVDSASMGGISCGINDDGFLNQTGYYKSGQNKVETDTGIKLDKFKIPAYQNVVNLVKDTHFKIPYFRLVAWDVAIDEDEEPVLIEYNTYRMGISSLQIAYGPFKEEFVDELLKKGRSN